MCRDRENWYEKRTGLSLFPRPCASYFNLNLFPRRPYYLRAWYRLCFVQYDFNFRSTVGHTWKRSEGRKRVGMGTGLNFKPNCRMMIISSCKEVQSLMWQWTVRHPLDQLWDLPTCSNSSLVVWPLKWYLTVWKYMGCIDFEQCCGSCCVVFKICAKEKWRIQTSDKGGPVIQTLR